MKKIFQFDELNIFEKYFQKQIINLQNVNTSLYYKLNKYFYNTREKIIEYLTNKNDFKLSFQVNQEYAVKILIKNFLNKNSFILTDTDLAYQSEHLKIKKFNTETELSILISDKKIDSYLILISSYNLLSKHSFWDTINYLRTNKNIHICWIADYFLYESKNLKETIAKNVDSFVYSPYYAFGIIGVYLLAIKKHIIDEKKIEPVVFGGGITFNLPNEEYEFKTFPAGCEAGTNNFPLWLLLCKYFENLLTYEKEIIEYLEIKSQKFEQKYEEYFAVEINNKKRILNYNLD